MHRLVVPVFAAGKTIEHYLLADLGFGPRRALKRAFLGGAVRLNGRAARRNDILTKDDYLEIRSPDVFTRDQLIIRPNPALTVPVLFESPDLVVVDKPAGMSAHPLKPTETETALNAIAGRYPETAFVPASGNALEGGLLHRLDRGTSGVLACARVPALWSEIRSTWKSKEIEKVYIAWVLGSFESPCSVTFHLGHDPKSRKRMIAFTSPSGDLATWEAITSFSPIRTTLMTDSRVVTLVMIRIHTGVTHQIRATLAALGYPVIADPIYEHVREARETELLEVDPATRWVFRNLRGSVAALSSPTAHLLPARGFFLHALSIRSDKIRGLEQGVIAPPPEHFGG